jgi:signal transduction histidine kinase
MLENLINDMMDLAKLENNSFNISNDYFNLKELIFEAFGMLSHLAEKH